MERDKGSPIGLDEGWKEVVRKKKPTHRGRGKLDVATAVWKPSNKDTFSFYFSEFPETHGAKEMLKAFKLYGDALEVVIPPKRDKWGRRFGFVRFSNVKDSQMFAIKLDNIIFGSTKIHVNIPRFQREKHAAVLPHDAQHSRVAARQRYRPLNNQQPRQIRVVWRKKEDEEAGGRKLERTEKQNVWRKEADHSNVTPKIVHHRKKNIAEVCYNVGEEDMQKFRKMYVGAVRTSGSTYSIHEWFSMQGFLLIKVTPLGANKALLEEMEEGVIQDLMNDYKDWMCEKFVGIKRWDPDVIDNERVVWVRCHGIPIHAWTDEFFASLARNFGEYLGVDEATRTKTTMDVARIRLRSNGYDVFNAEVTANINGSLFPIKMVEEWCGPLHWIENSCCKKHDNFDDSSDSEDDHNGEPPLFAVEDDSFSSSEEVGDGGERGSEEEEERDVGYDEVSFVQETLGIHDERRLENDHDYAEDQPMVYVEVGKPKELNEVYGGNIRGGNEIHAEIGNMVRDSTHVSNSKGCGGSQVSVGVEKEEISGAKGGISSEEGCEKQGSPLIGNGEVGGEKNNTEVGELTNGGGCENQSSPAKIKKRKNKNGPETRKKKEKRKKKKDQEAQQAANATPSCSLLRPGVVRNPFSLFQPSSSNSVAPKATVLASQVESIGDSGIVMGNNRFAKEMERSKAEKLWSLAKDKLGVSADANDDEMYIERIKAMEERDMNVKGRKGKTQVSK